MNRLEENDLQTAASNYAVQGSTSEQNEWGRVVGYKRGYNDAWDHIESEIMDQGAEYLRSNDEIWDKVRKLESENLALKESLGVSEPWNVIHVIEKLAEATDFLLNHRNYDRTGWEEIAHCVKLGREYGDKITEALKPKK